MIRTIMLTHNYTEAVSSTSVCLFFRMAGIYVVENYLDFTTDLKDELIEFDISPIKNLEDYCDVEIILIPESDKEWTYKPKKESSLVIKVSYKKTLDNCQKGISEPGLIKVLLEELAKKELLNEAQKRDLFDLEEVFSTVDYVRTIMLTKYFFVFQDDKWIESMIKKYKQIIQAVKQSYWAAVEDDGNVSHAHIRHALINTAYEINLYCRRCEKNQIYSNREIIDMAEELKLSSGRLLERSLEVLLAQVENNLLRDRNTSYDRLTELCRNDNKVNSYVFFLKGNYWMSEADCERASKYYREAIARFPAYYRAWYQMGRCFYIQGKEEGARKAFNVVKCILTERYEKNVLRPMEVEYLYRACIYCGKIQESYSAFWGALTYYGFAKKVWESIETSEFIKLLEQGWCNEEKILFVPQMQSEFDISELDKRIKRCKEYLGV